MMSQSSSIIDYSLYETIIAILVAVCTFVFLGTNFVWSSPFLTSQYPNTSLIELVWTILPLVLLVAIAIPSNNLLYYENNQNTPSLLINVIGHQWYWSYYYSNFDFQVDSYLLPNSELNIGDDPLLTCDEPCVIPIGVPVQFLITSEDVLHSWAIPSISVNNDAIPGISSLVETTVSFPGLFFGMCSELCGAYHAYMPINLEVTSPSLFVSWINS